MKKILTFFLPLFLLIGCSPQSPVSKINIPSTTPTTLLCLWEETISIDLGTWTLTLLIKQAQIPDYNISVQYLTTANCETDRKEAKWIKGGVIDPQGRPVISYPGRTDFKEYKPCFFSPISVYTLSGTIEEAVAYFEKQDTATYTPIPTLGDDDWFWSTKRGSDGIFGKNIIKKFTEGSVKLYSRIDPEYYTSLSQEDILKRYVMFNKDTPNQIYKIDTSWDDCGGYPDHSVIDFIE